METVNRSPQVWALLGLVAGIAVVASFFLVWLALSVDVLARDEIVVSATEVRSTDVTGGLVVPIAGGVVALIALLALARRGVTWSLAVMMIIAALVVLGASAYAYVARDTVFTDAVVDATAAEDIPADAVERAVDLALRSGAVEVEPRTGLFAAFIGGALGLVAGLLLLRDDVGAASAPQESAGDGYVSERGRRDQAAGPGLDTEAGREPEDSSEMHLPAGGGPATTDAPNRSKLGDSWSS